MRWKRRGDEGNQSGMSVGVVVTDRVEHEIGMAAELVRDNARGILRAPDQLFLKSGNFCSKQ